MTFETQLEFLRRGHLDRETRRTKTETRLKQLNSKLESFFTKQEEALREDVDIHVACLKEFLQGQTILNEVCK